MSETARSVVFFDALGTLFRLTPPHVIIGQVMTRLGFELGEEDALRLVDRATRWWADPDRQPGRTVSEELAERRHYVRMVLEDYGRPNDARLAAQLVEDAYWARWARPYLDARSALAGLSGAIRLALLSNGGPSVLDAVRHAGFAGYFEHMIVGLVAGAQKPEAEAYLSAAASLGVAPAASWLVDDTPENVRGALECGMRGVLLDRTGQWPEWEGAWIGSLDRLPAMVGVPQQTTWAMDEHG